MTALRRPIYQFLSTLLVLLCLHFASGTIALAKNGPTIAPNSGKPGHLGRDVLSDGISYYYYYIPDTKSALKPKSVPRNREFLVAVHGAGKDRGHTIGAYNKIAKWRRFADQKNWIIIAPIFGYVFPPQNLSDRDWPRVKTPRKRIEIFPYFSKNKSNPGHWLPRPPRTYEEKGEYLYYYKNNIGNGDFFRKYKDPLKAGGKHVHLNGFHLLINKSNFVRSDQKLHEMVETLARRYPDVDSAQPRNEVRFNIVGWSGGGQFVSRYMMIYPEKLLRIALGGGRTYMFPEPDAGS